MISMANNNHIMMTNMLLILVLVFSCHMSDYSSSVHAYQFVVGGRRGWVMNPSESYNHWAERMRFQVNDTLVFKYNNAYDSVLVVNKNGYDTCGGSNPIRKFTDGNSVFAFDRNGPFYFISGNKSNCDQGEKMIIVVLAVRNGRSLPPSTSGPPPQGSPAPPTSSPSLAPSPEIHGSGPAPSASSPSLTPSPANNGSGPSPVAANSPESTGLAPGSSASPGSDGGTVIGNGSPSAGNNSPGGGGTGGSRPGSWGVATCMPSLVLAAVGWLIAIGL